MNATTLTRIMQICGEMPNAAAHRHYLEQLPTRQLEQRLEDLEASEKKHAGRWYAGRDTAQPHANRSRLGLATTP